MTQLLTEFEMWVWPITQIAVILLTIVFYLLEYRFTDRRTRTNRVLRNSAFTILIIVGVGNLFSIGATQISRWQKKHEAHIVMSPSGLKVNKGDFLSSQRVSLYNRSEVTAHSIWIRMSLDGCGMHWDEISLEPRFDGDWDQMAHDIHGGPRVFSEIWGLGALDSEGKEMLWLLVRSLEAASSLSFDVNLPKRDTTETTWDCVIGMELRSYSDQPMEIVNFSGGVGPRFSPPEEMTALGIAMLISTK
jgi:hypothetical protein